MMGDGREFTPEELADIRAALEVGLSWLDMPQDADASHSHLGIHGPTVANLALSVCHFGHGGKPVVIFEDNGRRFPTGDAPRPPLNEREVAQLREVVDSLSPVSETWNGVGLSTLSCKLARDAGEGALTLSRNYQSFEKIKNPAKTPEGWS